ncbi:MAG TPA: SdrD B-like domain-containing protein [Thermoanaerobaculia bacterium]|nr:SdrD B-like domain-containing protein [Thermoanaerobaculia bacterium]
MRMKAALFGLSTVILLSFGAPLHAQVTGSVTTVNGSGGSQDLFRSIEELFLAGGPTTEPCSAWDSLSDGLYYFQVTDPTGVDLLSTDPVEERAFRVRGGVIASYEGTTHALGGVNACGSLSIGLMPFAAAGSRCPGGYLVWVTPAAAFEGDPAQVDFVCGDGCFHGFRPELSRTFVARLEPQQQRRACDRTFCVSGVKFDDRDGDGVRDSGEPGLGGVEIRVVDERTGAAFTSITFPDGAYRICGLTQGRSFRVIEVPPFAFQQTGPLDRRFSRRVIARDRGYFIEFCDADVAGLDFGNRLIPNAIGGSKFEDLNANGVRDAGEPGMGNVTIRLTPAAGGTARTLVTDGAGNFLFTEVAPGSYVLSEVVPTGFTQTAPPAGTIPVTLASGGTSINNLFGNFRGVLTGTISGSKFNDANGNGTLDAGETGLPGVTITLTPVAGGQFAGGTVPPTRTVVTGAGGAFSFGEVPLGSYTLSETVPAGFQQTAPPAPGTIGVTLTFAARNSVGNLFGNRALGASVSGTKFNDANGNGSRDAGESGLAGVTIRLTSAGGQVTTATSDASGNFSFTGLAAGAYTVSEVVPTGFVQTAPAAPGTFALNLTTGQVVTGLLFGNRAIAPGETGTISGRKWLDLNENGVVDGLDRGLEGIVIRLTNASGVVRETVSDLNGNFSFTNLPPGTYVLSEVLPPGFFQTFPGTPNQPGTHTITLAPGQSAPGFLFLNKC